MAENRELALVLKLVADQFQSELKNSQGALGQFNSFIKDWKTQLTAAGMALFAVAKSTANFGEEALKGAQKAGQTVETFTALSYAAKLADIDQQQLSVGLKSLSQNMVEAAQRTGDGEALFRRLGIAATDATGQLRPTEQVLLELADVFARSADGAGKTEAAVKLFGKAGLELIPFLNQGKAGIAGLMEEAKRLGVVVSEDAAKSADTFNNEIKRLQAATQGLTLQLGNELQPAFIELFKSMNGGLGLFNSLIGKVRELGSETSNVGQNLKNWSDAFGQTRIGQGMMDTFTAMGFGHRKGEGTLPREQFWMDALKSIGGLGGQLPPGGGVLASPGGEDKPQMALGAGPQREADAHVEDFKKHFKEHWSLVFTGAEGMRRDVEGDVDRLIRELVDDNARTIEQINKDFAGDTPAERQTAAGYRIVAQAQAEFRQREQQELVDNLQAWQAYYDQVGGSAEFRYTKELDLVRATLAQQINMTTEEAGRLLIAWQNHDGALADMILSRTALTEQQRETIMLKTLKNVAEANQRVSNDVFGGWALGMQKYIDDTKSGFGLAADMARRSAQEMEQAFRTGFFDLFEGRVKSMKDVLGGLANFVKQVASQVAAQLATSFVLKGLNSMSGFFTTSDTGWMNNIAEFFGADFTHKANGGLITPRHYAVGGRVLGTGNQDTIPAMLTPGEFVMRRSAVDAYGVGTLDRMNQGALSATVPTSITVNIHGAPQDSAASVDVRRTTDSMVIDVLLRHQRDLRPLFGGV